MAQCPTCQAELPQFALHCVECGASVATATAQEQGTLDRLCRLSGTAESTAGQSTLMGSAGRGAVDRTLPQGMSRYDMVLDSTEDLSDSFPATQPMLHAESPQLVSLSGASATIRDDGGPARLRPEATPAASQETAPPDPKPTPRVARGVIRPGQRVEEYLVEAEIGRGGMGRVYRAVHTQIGQVVALKMLLPQFFDEERQMKRFLNEAKVLVHLQHPNLVPLLGFPTHEGRPLIVMPFIEGETLEKLLARQGRLSLERALELFCQICEGLACVHEHGVMHRDLKPANILIRSTDGQALLTDFGIARAVGSERLTLTGMVVGTAEYLSPEQASGSARDDLRGDVYSVGILLYEMLTGQVPFRHVNAAQVLMKQVSAPPPPPRLIVPELTQLVERVILRALAKDPDDRYQTVRDFRDAVLAAVEGNPLATPEPTRPVEATVKKPRAAERTDPPATIERVERAAEATGGLRRLMGQILLGAAIGAATATALWYALAHL